MEMMSSRDLKASRKRTEDDKKKSTRSVIVVRPPLLVLKVLSRGTRTILTKLEVIALQNICGNDDKRNGSVIVAGTEKGVMNGTLGIQEDLGVILHDDVALDIAVLEVVLKTVVTVTSIARIS
jgi:hypothetical protein